MCLWKDHYSQDELLGSTATLIQQLKVFRRQCRFAKSGTMDDYTRWLMETLSFNRLNRFVDQLLDVARRCVSMRPVVAQILLQLELKDILPDRRLQMKYLQNTANVAKAIPPDTPGIYDGYPVKLEKAHV